MQPVSIGGFWFREGEGELLVDKRGMASSRRFDGRSGQNPVDTFPDQLGDGGRPLSRESLELPVLRLVESDLRFDHRCFLREGAHHGNPITVG